MIFQKVARVFVISTPALFVVLLVYLLFPSLPSDNPVLFAGVVFLSVIFKIALSKFKEDDSHIETMLQRAGIAMVIVTVIVLTIALYSLF
jgi:hypothetical protein